MTIPESARWEHIWSERPSTHLPVGEKAHLMTVEGRGKIWATSISLLGREPLLASCPELDPGRSRELFLAPTSGSTKPRLVPSPSNFPNMAHVEVASGGRRRAHCPGRASFLIKSSEKTLRPTSSYESYRPLVSS